MNLYWYKHKEGNGNFGDELNPYIIKALSGIQPKYVDVAKLPASKKVALKAMLSNLTKGRFSLAFQKENWVTLSNQNVIVAIGSVISWFSSPNIIVWGSGIIQEKSKIHPADFRAVRGKYTLKRLRELGYNTEQTVLGDPALLLPLIFPYKAVTKKYKVGIIPHYIHYDKIKKQIKNDEILIINLLDPIEKILEEIMMCELTLSSSLHGIIVSHAYEVPSLWASFPNLDLLDLAGDDIKFADYFSSLSMPEYPAVPVDFKEFEVFKIKYADRILPNKKNTRELQSGLLKCAPFKIETNSLLPK